MTWWVHLQPMTDRVKNKNIVAQDTIVYSHIFDKDMEKQVAALRLFKNLWSERQAILKAQQEEEQQPGDPVQTVLCSYFYCNKLLLLLSM